jgi:FtsH-binding integral membrane protein
MFTKGSSLFTKGFNNNELNEDVQIHLVKVYMSLALTILTAIIGVAANIILQFGGIFAILLSFGLLFYLKLDQDKTNLKRRLCILGLFGFLNGSSIGPLIRQALLFQNGELIVFVSLLCTMAIFISFTLSAKMAKRRSYLFLGGLLGSALNMLAMLTLISIFVPSLSFMFMRIYGGLLLFSGFVIYDTQIIIEQAYEGNRDVIGHALSLFLDFVNIFIRVLIIVMRKGERRNDNSTILPRFRKSGGDVFDL